MIDVGVDVHPTPAEAAVVAEQHGTVVVSAVFLLQNSLSPNVFAVILYATIVMLALLHVGPVRTPKTGKHMNYVVTAFVVILTAIYSFILWTQ